MTLGQKIKDMRKQMGISQEMLGEILNVSRQAITKWETDAGVPEVYNLQELSNVFGVPVDYFLSNKSINCNTKQLDIDITKYRNNKENNVEIIRHFYSEEWSINFLNYTMYPKNIFIRIGLFIGNMFSNHVRNGIDATQLLYDIDKLEDNYYLLVRDEIILIAFITNNRLEIKDISNIKIKNASLVSFGKHFVYNDKMFHICTYEKAENIDNKKSLWLEIQGIIKAWLYIILGVIGMFAIIGLLLLIVGLFN